MIKIEKMSDGCVAKINGNPILLYQLYTHEEFKTLEHTDGTFDYTIYDREIKTVVAPLKEKLEISQGMLEASAQTAEVKPPVQRSVKTTAPKAKTAAPVTPITNTGTVDALDNPTTVTSTN